MRRIDHKRTQKKSEPQMGFEPTTLRVLDARQRVLSSSEVRASDLEHGGSWVRIPSGAQIFSVSSYGPFFLVKVEIWICWAEISHFTFTTVVHFSLFHSVHLEAGDSRKDTRLLILGNVDPFDMRSSSNFGESVLAER